MPRSGSFGAPRPLPGQRGYKMRESERLESEAAAMEARLRDLRDQMSSEKTKRDAKGAVGESRWRSAAKSRGSIRQYSKDVRGRRSKRGAGQAQAQAPAQAKQPQQPQAAAAAPKPQQQQPFEGKDVAAWTVADSVAWLTASGLGQYGGAFETNEISGGILLELGLDDLDYMSVTVLAHRKRLLKGIEALKRGERAPLPAPASGHAPAAAKAMAMTAAAAMQDDDHSPQRAQAQAQEKRVHWSHVAPLSESEVQGDGSVPVNLADGAFDEDASRASFQEALMEWRNAGRDLPETSPNPEPEPADGMWHNPFAPSPAAAADQAGGAYPEPAEDGGQLLRGSLDETAEHEQFVKAVESWRSGAASEPRHGCWQCYAVRPEADMVRDADTQRFFCNEQCRDAAKIQCARDGCGRDFVRGDGRFCSRECAAEHRRAAAVAPPPAQSDTAERLEKLRAEIAELEAGLSGSDSDGESGPGSGSGSGPGSGSGSVEARRPLSARIAPASPIASPRPDSPPAEYTVAVSDSESDSGAPEAPVDNIWDVEVKFA